MITEKILQRKNAQLRDLQAALELADGLRETLRENEAGRMLMPVQAALGYCITGLRTRKRRLVEEIQHTLEEHQS